MSMRSARCFGLRKGRRHEKLPVGLGSHLDTQPTAASSTALGTLAALEVVPHAQ